MTNSIRAKLFSGLKDFAKDDVLESKTPTKTFDI